MSFSIYPATQADVPILAKISDDAFRADRHTRVKALNQTDYLESMMCGVLTSWVQQPNRYSVIKATDDYTNEIIGWVCWATRRGDGQPPHTAPQPDGDNGKTEQSPQDSIKGSSAESEVAVKERSEDPLQVLESITNADMARWQKIFMPTPTTKCMYIVAITVSPAHQSHGVGSALIQWGTKKADADGLFCWVHASEAGHTSFAKKGFEEVGKLTVDLDEYAPRPRNDGDGDPKWGLYTFRYMKRLPKERQVSGIGGK
ncbi:hypothetical protein V1517DRAFT_330617 [Lipomyces orientalis]|uniref:Uncharacterized protein n=1 Tax=Lipomyces orientalis TaxID=1233043 RepID=A0ACC3TFX7_9ASCO